MTLSELFVEQQVEDRRRLTEVAQLAIKTDAMTPSDRGLGRRIARPLARFGDWIGPRASEQTLVRRPLPPLDASAKRWTW